MDGAGLTFESVAARYMALRRAGGLAPGTIGTYREVFRLFAFDLGHSRPVARITRADVERWVSHQKVGPATLRLRLSTLHTFFEWCTINGLVKRDPTLGVARPRLPHRLPRSIPAPDVERALDGAEDRRDLLMALLMCQEGLRACEVSRLQVGDIDETDRLLLVHGKGGHERTLPISGETWDALIAYRGAPPSHLPAGPLVRSYVDESAITANYISRRVAGVLRAAELGGKAHRLRHTMASDMLDNGATVRDVQVALGHASLANTQIYVRARQGADLRGVMGGRSYRGARTGRRATVPR